MTVTTASGAELERDSAVPLYAQLEEIFRKQIADGVWNPNERIPSENVLTAQYGVARMTVRNVLTKMSEDGALFRVPGKGTFVTGRKISASSPAYMGVREQLERMGYTIHTRLEKLSRERASDDIRSLLELGEDDDVFVIERLRYADGEPISRHQSWVPAKFALNLGEFDIVNEQLCVVLDREFGQTMAHVEERLETIGASQRTAELLGIRQRDPVLLLHDLIRNRANRPFEYSRITFRGDRMQLRFNYDL